MPKFRTDFVTNSSSSSFVCEICGCVESGYDMYLREAGMCECVNGHIICDCHLESENREVLVKAMLNMGYDEDKLKDMGEDYLISSLIDNYYSEIPEEVCPICQFIEYSEEDLAVYLLKKYNVPRETVFAEIKKYNRRRRKLYDSEYITYVCKKFNLDPTDIVAGWKYTFGSYKAFWQWLKN